MAEKKIIAVMGATGAQGGGLVNAILNDPNSEFIPRAVVRDINSDKAKELASRGAEVVAGDLDDAESIKRAFEGAYGAYCVTFFWHHFSPEKELGHAKIMADAAKEAGLKHVIWSTLEDTRTFVPLESDQMPTLHGKYKVPHFDGKGEADQFFKEARIPTTYFYISFYWDNLIGFMPPQKDNEGRYAVTMPMGDKKLAGISGDDIGKCAYGIFKAGDKYINQSVGLAGEHLTVNEMAAKLSQALGKDIYYNPVTPEAYRGFGFPGADDLGNMFQFYADFEKEGLELRDVGKSKSLNPDLKNFDQWLAVNKNKIPMG